MEKNMFNTLEKYSVPNDMIIDLQNIEYVALELSSLCNYAILHKNCPLHLSKEHTIFPAKGVVLNF